MKKLILIVLYASCLSFGCHTTPTLTERSTISYDGNDKTAGIIGFLPNGSLEITPHKRQEYNEAIKSFGKKTVPTTEEDFGITALENGNYSITKEAVEHWYSMNLIRDRERIDDSDKLLNL